MDRAGKAGECLDVLAGSLSLDGSAPTYYNFINANRFFSNWEWHCGVKLCHKGGTGLPQ